MFVCVRTYVLYTFMCVCRELCSVSPNQLDTGNSILSELTKTEMSKKVGHFAYQLNYIATKGKLTQECVCTYTLLYTFQPSTFHGHCLHLGVVCTMQDVVIVTVIPIIILPHSSYHLVSIVCCVGI